MKIAIVCSLVVLCNVANAHPFARRKPARGGAISESARVEVMMRAMKIAWGAEAVTCRDSSWTLPHSSQLHVSTTCDMENIPGMPRGGFCDTNSGHASNGKFDCWTTYQTEPNQNPNVFASEESFLSPNGQLSWVRK